MAIATKHITTYEQGQTPITWKSEDGLTSDLGPLTADFSDVDDGVIRTIRTCRERWQRINQTADRQRLELNRYYAEQLEPVEKRLTGRYCRKISEEAEAWKF